MQGLFKRHERQVLCGVAVVVNALLLSACGSGATYNPSPTSSSVASVATQSFATQIDLSQATPAALSQQATPQFHVAPVVLDEPTDVDGQQPDVSAQLPPHTQNVPVELSNLSTRGLTLDTLRYVRRYGVSSSGAGAENSNAKRRCCHRRPSVRENVNRVKRSGIGQPLGMVELGEISSRAQKILV